MLKHRHASLPWHQAPSQIVSFPTEAAKWRNPLLYRQTEPFEGPGSELERMSLKANLDNKPSIFNILKIKLFVMNILQN
jgi:hypothetical protein